MNLEKVFFAFFIVLALTLNFGFFLGDLDDPNHHNVYELYAALVVSLIATIMKFGDRAHIGAACWPPAWSPICNSLLRSSSGPCLCMPQTWASHP